MTEFPPPKDYSHLIVDGWFHERGTLWPGQAFSLQIKEVLYHKKSMFQDVLVFDSENYGKVFVLDGVIQCTERDECRQVVCSVKCIYLEIFGLHISLSAHIFHVWLFLYEILPLQIIH
mmetsp:Transcript_16778/g.36216  ORF Transcript_16778/g.36216 Transcript_16778/m.36216 type:complete len:118 (-) Transcript_16778:903-1256(-)